jgi:hypothetical protein
MTDAIRRMMELAAAILVVGTFELFALVVLDRVLSRIAGRKACRVGAETADSCVPSRVRDPR